MDIRYEFDAPKFYDFSAMLATNDSPGTAKDTWFATQGPSGDFLRPEGAGMSVPAAAEWPIQLHMTEAAEPGALLFGKAAEKTLTLLCRCCYFTGFAG